MRLTNPFIPLKIVFFLGSKAFLKSVVLLMKWDSTLNYPFSFTQSAHRKCTGYSTLCSYVVWQRERRKPAIGWELKNLSSSPVLSYACFIISEVMSSGVRCFFDLGQVTNLWVSFLICKSGSINGNYLMGSR